MHLCRNPEPENVEAVSEPEDCDPDISKEIDRIERFIERRNAIRNGMKWMQSEALEAFEFYKDSISYQVCSIFTLLFHLMGFSHVDSYSSIFPRLILECFIANNKLSIF